MKNSRYKKAPSRITRRNKVKRIFGLVLKIGLPVAVLAGLVFLSRADFLQVKDFEVLGAETVGQDDIKNMAAGFASGTRLSLLPKSNIFLLNKEKLAAALLSKFTRLQKVDVNKQFFNKKVELLVSERKEDFLWCSERNECFFMTKDGLVFASPDTVSAESGKVVFRGVITGNPLMKNFASPEKMQNYINFIEVFKGAGFEITSVNVESSDKAVAKTNTGDVFFNPEEADLSLVAQNTILLINEVKSKNPSAQFNYIDSRFGNKIFYKLL